jgi:lipoprotein-anchoring transpeptidase ErfK/SrfK
VRRFAPLLIVIVALVVSAPALAQAPPTIAANVTIGPTDVGGMTVAEAKAAVEAAFAKPITIVFKGKRWTVKPTTLEASAAIDTTVTAALNAPAGAAIKLGVTVNPKRIAKYAAYLDRTYSKNARDARLVLKNLKPRIIRERVGIDVRPMRMASAISRSLKLNQRSEIALIVLYRKPKFTKADVGSVIVIRRGSRKLYLYKKTRLVRRFDIAVGMSGHATPLGRYRVISKEVNPTWNPPSSPWAAGLGPIPPGPGNPLGTRWIGTSAPAIGIHGTPQPWTVGTAASHGCIRMRIPEVEWLFRRVKVGTPIFIVSA